MRRAAPALAILTWVSVAQAAPARVTLSEAGVSFQPPAGWIEAPALARQVARGFAKEAELAGAPGQKLHTGGRAWQEPGDGAQKAVLHVQWIVAEKATPAAEVPALLRAELDDARQRPRLTALPRTAFELVAWSEKVEGALAWGQLEFRHVDNGTRTLARTSVFVDAGAHLHELRVECVMVDGQGALAGDDPHAPRAGCDAAMGGLTLLAPAALTPLPELPGQGTIRVTGDQLVDAADADVRPDGGLELKTPRPGDSAAVTPHTPPTLPAQAAAESRGFSRMLLVGGGVLLVLAMAVTVGARRKRADAGKPESQRKMK